MIKHRWREIETQKGDLETHECTICGCTRHKSWNAGFFKDFPGFTYVRNEIVYALDRPECYGDDADEFQAAMGHFNT